MRRVIAVGGALAILVVGLVLWTRGAGISALHMEPWTLEVRAARMGWRHLVPVDTRNAKNPVERTAAVLKAARKHWADHCAICHGNDGGGDTTVGRRVYPRAPDMRVARTQDLSDGELFYAIEQGIPWTAMPGWGSGNEAGAKESWALVHFIRHLPSITKDELREMERLNPVAPPDSEREKDINDFLNGPAARTPSRQRGN